MKRPKKGGDDEGRPLEPDETEELGSAPASDDSPVRAKPTTDPPVARGGCIYLGLKPDSDPAYDEVTIVLGGNSPPKPKAGFTPEGFMARLQYLVTQGPIHHDPPSDAFSAADLDEMDAEDDLIQEAMIQGLLLDEYRRNLRATKATKASKATKATKEAKDDPGSQEEEA